ncbi:hypothetical protein BBOV_II007660 [Babesia bovis T2Bo]|uniref:Kinetochore protein SPC25 n=1 Tax=Babesia bovis TaxID=5865 RepID=A7AUV5_BABBO|nr:hypothetical protein BBOV_II007660 [Babesia bovis T2Bo]EDO06716.1 hypothetical protein BBOV_II007660 [Babesia bovis T2Bo]|eukprot:XP_001610284.1 hypothetical protein [Babesia bovis T2Bo]
MPDVEAQLEALSELRFDIKSLDDNFTLKSRLSTSVDALCAFIRDDIQEWSLVNEFERVHQFLCQVFDDELRAANASVDGLKKELEEAEAEHRKLTAELDEIESSYNNVNDESSMLQAQQASSLIEEAFALSYAYEESILDEESSRHQEKLLSDIATIEKASDADAEERDRLLYEFLTSSLNITVVSANDKEVQFALLNEPEDRSTQTWDLVTVKTSEMDLPATSKYLWSLIERTFQHSGEESITNPVLDTVRLSL